MAEVKGTSVAGKRQYVLKHHGEEKLRTVLAQLRDREAAKRLETTVLKSSWYPFDFWVDLTQAIDRVVGNGDGRLFRPMAAQTAEDDLSTVYKVFFKFTEPMRIFERAEQLWDAYYRPGKNKITKISPTSVEMEIIDFDQPNWAHCESVLGWAERSVQLTGAKNVRCEHLECRGRGAARCRMRVSWTQ